MRTPQEIMEYLMLYNRTDIKVDDIIKDALLVEVCYASQIKENSHEYALACDFINSPFILEYEDEVERLEKVDEIGGLIVYKPIYKKVS